MVEDSRVISVVRGQHCKSDSVDYSKDQQYNICYTHLCIYEFLK